MPWGDAVLEILPRFVMPGSEVQAGGLIAPMPGKVIDLKVKVGSKVKKGETLVILEAMKMEHQVKASEDGKVSKLLIRKDDQLENGALLMVDCIASLGCDKFLMDEWGVDIMVTACQKGLMTPPGLAFVFFSDRAGQVRNAMERVSSYWDWNTRFNPDLFYQYFCGTAPTQHLLGLREALDMISEEGLSHIWSRHEALAKAVWAACEAWAQVGDLQMNISDEDLRSRAVTSISIGTPNGLRMRKWTEHEAGLTLGVGLGMNTPEDPNADGFFRIGHMGHVNAQMIMGALGSVQAGLIALDIPHGVGGLDAAASVLARKIG